MRTSYPLSTTIFLLLFRTIASFAPPPRSTTRPMTKLLLGVFDKMFQESGALGKGVTVGKVQVALHCKDRGPNSIFALLGSEARAMSDDPYDLATLCRDVCLALLRRKDDWVAAASTSEWFKGSEGGKAESRFNDWANVEAAKFEKEYVPESDDDDDKGGPTIAVVSIIVEIEGDETKFDGAGYSFSGTQEVLSSLASDVMVQDGDCLNAVEVFWTPSKSDEVLTRQDIILDFPELIDL